MSDHQKTLDSRSDRSVYSCSQCGACCVAPDISSLNKPVGVPCPHLDLNHRCSIYNKRPTVCRNYRPDELCNLITAPTLKERVKKYLSLFDLASKKDR